MDFSPNRLSKEKIEEIKRICSDKWTFRQYKKEFGSRQLIKIRKMYNQIIKAENKLGKVVAKN